MSGKSKRSRQDDASSPVQQQSRLVFPINDIHSRLHDYYLEQQNGLGITNISNNASIYLTAVLEYLSAEILELAGDRSHEVDASRIRVSHIRHAIRNEVEWSKVNLADVAIDNEMEDEDVEFEHSNPGLAFLPEQLLLHVASFLPTVSRALLAVGLTVSRGESNTSRAIISSSTWDGVINFEELEESLAERLTDDNVYSLLVLCDAPNKLKRLRLASCMGISGKGLEVLRGSVVVEQIVVGHHLEAANYRIILPILHSIIEAEGTALKHIQLPWEWRGNNGGDDEELSIRSEEFRQAYSIFLARNSTCSNCSNDDDPWYLSDPYLLQGQNNTCWVCLKSFCKNTDDDFIDDYDRGCNVKECPNCKNYFCANCSGCNDCDGRQECSDCDPHPTSVCGLGCGKQICEQHTVSCDHCNRTGCCDCFEEAGFYGYCKGCEQHYCQCNVDARPDDHCGKCSEFYCDKCTDENLLESAICNIKGCRYDGGNCFTFRDCPGCKQLVCEDCAKGCCYEAELFYCPACPCPYHHRAEEQV